MFAKPKPAPAPAPVPAPKANPSPPAAPSTTAQPPEPQDLENESLPPPPPSMDPVETPMEDSAEALAPSEPEPRIPSPKDKLTETNLEQVLDTSAPPPTGTQASTVASSLLTPGLPGPSTPYSSGNQLPAARPPMGGFASSAYRATGVSGRSTSFQRRVLDQQEAVVMPNNPAVDRAAVQFGSLGLNGAGDDVDVDDEREDAETRAQPPQHSPVAHPVASLPPAPHQSLPPQQSPVKEPEPTPRQAPGLPVAPQAQQAMAAQPTASQSSLGTPSAAHQSSQGSQAYGQFNRYGQPATQPEPALTAPKSYDPFGHQTNQVISSQNQFEGYSTLNPTQQPQPQQPQHSQLGAFSSAATDYSSYYTADPQQRGGYPNYYNAVYNQQSGQGLQDAGADQARSGSGLGQSTVADPSPYSTAPTQPQGPSRYGQAGETQNSGHSTPNPALVGQQPPQQQQQQSQQPPAPQQQQQQQPQGAQSQQSQHLQGQQPQTQAGAHAAYPYGHPYFSSPYYAAYMNQVSRFRRGGIGGRVQKGSG
ncbi:MAG TPA: hypothetical protein VIW92_07690 [Thermoanaerobaculia bacterium]